MYWPFDHSSFDGSSGETPDTSAKRLKLVFNNVVARAEMNGYMTAENRAGLEEKIARIIVFLAKAGERDPKILTDEAFNDLQDEISVDRLAS